MEIEIEGVQDVPHDRWMAMGAVGAIMALLERAVKEDEGERYVELVNAAHDLGDHIFKRLHGIDQPLKLATRTVIESVAEVGVLQ